MTGWRTGASRPSSVHSDGAHPNVPDMHTPQRSVDLSLDSGTGTGTGAGSAPSRRWLLASGDRRSGGGSRQARNLSLPNLESPEGGAAAGEGEEDTGDWDDVPADTDALVPVQGQGVGRGRTGLEAHLEGSEGPAGYDDDDDDEEEEEEDGEGGQSAGLKCFCVCVCVGGGWQLEILRLLVL